MSEISHRFLTGQPTADGEPPKPYLRIGQATLFVADQDRSLKFYIEKLGLKLVADIETSFGIRWVAVSFPDGSTILELVAPTEDSKEYGLIGQMNRLMLITEDVAEVYRQWSAQGVHFHTPPQGRDWGGISAAFDDPDGNASIQRHQGRPAQEIASLIRQDLESFSNDEKFDDVTLIIAKVKSAPDSHVL